MFPATPSNAEQDKTAIPAPAGEELPAKGMGAGRPPVPGHDGEKDERNGSFTDTEKASGAGTFCSSEPRPGTSWMRMRTPSPATPRDRGSKDSLPPTDPALPSTMLQQLQYITAVVTKAPWFTQADSTSADWGKSSGVDTPRTRASTGETAESLNIEEKLPVKEVTAEDAPSKGSIGHPYCCAAPCKYIKKARGCKDGVDCDRCHLCVFRCIKPGKKATEDSLQNSSTVDGSPPLETCTQVRPKRRHGTRGRKHRQAPA